METTAVLRMQGISKRYPGVRALRDAALELRAGEVHILLGENGAGKSTLMKVLSGAVRRDAGEILVDGQPVDIPDPAAARRLGISTIYQELSLVPIFPSPRTSFPGRLPLAAPGLSTGRRCGREPRRRCSRLAFRSIPMRGWARCVSPSSRWSRSPAP
jgi:ribose transport system ATP-binding protein